MGLSVKVSIIFSNLDNRSGHRDLRREVESAGRRNGAYESEPRTVGVGGGFAGGVGVSVAGHAAGATIAGTSRTRLAKRADR